MSLSDLIRKRATGNVATAIPAIPATDEPRNASIVARIATVAVATSHIQKTTPANESPPATVAEQQAAFLGRPALVSKADLLLIQRELLPHLVGCRDCCTEGHLYCTQAERTGNGYAAYLTEFPDADRRHTDFVSAVIKARIWGIKRGFTELDALAHQREETGRETACRPVYGIDNRPAELAFVNHFTVCAYCFPRSGKYCAEGRVLHDMALLEALQ